MTILKVKNLTTDREIETIPPKFIHANLEEPFFAGNFVGTVSGVLVLPRNYPSVTPISDLIILGLSEDSCDNICQFSEEYALKLKNVRFYNDDNILIEHLCSPSNHHGYELFCKEKNPIGREISFKSNYTYLRNKKNQIMICYMTKPKRIEFLEEKFVNVR